jgi:taurine dioxygenase
MAHGSTSPPQLTIPTQRHCARGSGMRQVSAGLEQRCDALGWQLEHLGVTIGTVIHGPDLSTHQSEEAIGAMYAVLLERKVIFFRDQDLTPGMQRDFGRRFGSLEVFPFTEPPDEDVPEILPIRSGPGYATGASNWHSDVTWRKSPSLGSILYCAVAPPFGGETGFADTYATFQGLSADDREMLRGKTCIHDFDFFRRRMLREGVSKETVEELRTSYPVARHPMIRTHPDTGGEMLYGE